MSAAVFRHGTPGYLADTVQDVIREIVKRDRQKDGLTEAIVLHDAKQLHEAACEHFGTWEIALRYAGVDTRCLRGRLRYSRSRVTQAVRKLCITGYCLSAKRNMRRDSGLFRAAIHHFGTWRQALEAAGIDVRHARLGLKPRQLDRKRIMESLRRRHQAGFSLTWSEVCLEDRALATAAENAFVIWQKTLVAAGFVSEERGEGGERDWGAAPQRRQPCHNHSREHCGVFAEGAV